jgi:3-oxoacyl-[acyl-carrier-protein] synthase III
MGKITAAITAIQGYVPDEIVTNNDLAKIVDTSDEWILSRTGISERRILREGGASVIATKAVEGLLKKRGIRN